MPEPHLQPDGARLARVAVGLRHQLGFIGVRSQGSVRAYSDCKWEDKEWLTKSHQLALPWRSRGPSLV